MMCQAFLVLKQSPFPAKAYSCESGMVIQIKFDICELLLALTVPGAELIPNQQLFLRRTRLPESVLLAHKTAQFHLSADFMLI